jgi:hypothetical protein
MEVTDMAKRVSFVKKATKGKKKRDRTRFDFGANVAKRRRGGSGGGS